MYTIFSDDVCIYDDLNNTNEYRLIDPVWHREDNTSGSLTFTMPTCNAGYNVVERLKSRIFIYKDDVEVWEGRVISENYNFNKERAITCEGALGFLNDVIQPQREFINPTVEQFLRTIIDYHNSKVDSSRQFTLGTVTVTSPMIDESGDDEYDDDVYVYTNYENTFDCIREKLIEKNTDKYNDKKKDLKGHLRIRKVDGVRYLDYLKDYPKTSSQIIEFGQNLLDFTIDYDESEYCTVLIPLGERYSEGEVDGLEGYLDIRDVNDGKNYIESSGVSTFGRIERIEHFDDITDEEELMEKAIEYLRDVQFGRMKLSVDAFDLSLLNVNTEEIELLDEIRVLSSIHGLDRLFPVSEIEIKLDEPGSTKYTLGLEDILGDGALATVSAYTRRMEIQMEEDKKDIYGTVESLDKKTQASIENLGDEITIKVEEVESELGAKIDVTKEEIELEVKGVEEDLNTEIKSSISIAKDEIRSEVAGSQKEWDTTGYTISEYGYEDPDSEGLDPSEYNGKYYLNQTNGYIYRSNGSTWSFVKSCTSIFVELRSEISQTKDQINLKVDKNDVINQINISKEGITIAGNRINISGNTTFTATQSTAQNAYYTATGASATANSANSTANAANTTANNLSNGLIRGTTTINGGCISTGTIDASKVTVTNLKAESITSGTLSAVTIDTQKNVSCNNVSCIKLSGRYLETSEGANIKGSLTVQSGSMLYGGVSFRGVSHGSTSDAFLRITGTTSGSLCYTTSASTGSSQRYKYDIKDVEDKELDPYNILRIPVHQFRYNDMSEAATWEKVHPVIGFIAEEVNDIYPVATVFNSYGQIENWEARYIVPPMLQIIKDQQKKIQELETRLIKMEEKVC